MRSWTLLVITFAFIAGVSAATWVVATHEPKLTVAHYSGLISPPEGFSLTYNPANTPDSIEEMETELAGRASRHFVWWTYLGEMHFAAGNLDRAREAWAEGARLARMATEEDLPESKQWAPWYRLGWCEMRLGNERPSISALMQAQLYLQDNIDRESEQESRRWRAGSAWVSRLFLGYTYRHMGSELLARDAWAEALELFLDAPFPDWVERRDIPAYYHYHAGRLLELSGDREGALRAFEAGAANRGFWRMVSEWTPALEQLRGTPEYEALKEIERSRRSTWLPEFARAEQRWQRGSREYGG
jgi:tetratricopeptide (TPR) repeat protein